MNSKKEQNEKKNGGKLGVGKMLRYSPFHSLVVQSFEPALDEVCP
jgi:hypothetical protein